MTIDYAERARALVGTRFRPQGRSTDGVDCVGLVLNAFAIEGHQFRNDYRLRGESRRELEGAMSNHFRRVPAGQLRRGDVMLLAASPEQLHLAVRTADGFVHAHAGLRRVVETPGFPPWTLLGAYRRRIRTGAR